MTTGRERILLSLLVFLVILTAWTETRRGFGFAQQETPPAGDQILVKEPGVLSAEANFAVQTPLERQGPGGSPVIVSSAQNQKGRPPFREGELLVKFVPGINGAGELQRHGMRSVRHFDFIGVHVAALPPGLSVAQGMASLSNNPNLVYAEPNYLHSIDQQVIPNDPNFGVLWGLHNTGQTIGGAPGLTDADTDAPEAWTIRTSASSVIVAVIDTGVDYTHPDLAANMWKNLPELNGVPGFDDDGNGIIDDIYGARWTNGNGTPTSGNPFDDNNPTNHGTHVSGTIGAVGNNGVGVVGVAWQVQIMALKFLNSTGSGSTADAIAAIQYGIVKGAKVLNNSWGGGGFSQALQDAITAANNAGVLFAAAAGNSSTNNDQLFFYPANYPVSNVISVAATDNQDQLASFSNYGVGRVHLAAPGVNIYSTKPASAYQYLSGTSMATPQVSGAAALVLAQYAPGTFNSTVPVQVRSRLMATTDPIGALAGKTISGGRLNLFKALSACSASLSLRPGLAPGFVAYLGEDMVLSAVLFANCTTVTGATVIAGFSNGDAVLPLLDNGVAPDLVANDGVYTVKWRPGLGGSAQAGAVQVTFVAAALSQTVAAPISGTEIDRISYNREPAPFSWTDISATGTNLPLSDEVSAVVTVPFTFNFYGRNYTQVTVGSNGTLNFAGKHLGFNVPLCIPRPTGYATDTYLAPFWDDLYPGLGGGTVKYQVVGTAPNRQFIVQFTNVQVYPSSPSGASFQAILYEATNQVKFQYQDTDFGVAWDKGATAISGLQEDATHGVRSSCQSPELLNSTAALFTPTRPNCGVSLPLSMTRSGNTVTITFGIGTNRPVTGSWFLAFLIWTGTEAAFFPIPLFSGPLPLLEPPVTNTGPIDIGTLPAFGVMNIFFRADSYPCNSSFAWAPSSSAVTSAPSLSRERLDRFIRSLTLQDFTAGKVLAVKP